MNFLQTIPRFAIPFRLSDYLSSWKALFSDQVVPTDAFAELLGPHPKFWTSSGRQALWLILKGLRLPKGAGVAVPLYSDISVQKAIRGAGFRPVYVDIDEQTLTMDPEHLARVKHQVQAIVVVHFFGHVAHLDRLLEVAGGIPVIEDTAHAPLSYYGDRPVGSFGVASLYSFASAKYWPAGGGGLAVINDRALAARVAEEAAHLEAPSLWSEWTSPLGQLAKSILFRRPLYGLLGRPLRPRAEAYGLLEPSLGMIGIQRGHAAVAVRQCARFARLVKRQRENSLRLRDLLAGMQGVVLPFERKGVQYNHHLFPVLLANREERDGVAASMLARHVDTSKIYFDVTKHARDLGYEGDCPVSESAADRMLTLPNYASLSGEQIKIVAGAFVSALKEYRECSRAVERARNEIREGAIA